MISRHSKRNFLSDQFHVIATIGLMIIFIAIQFQAHKTIGIDQDELQHIHAAWNIHRGQVMYIDFFEHHFPWFHAVLQPFFSFFDVTNSDDGPNILFACRKMAILMTTVTAIVASRYSKSIYGSKAAWLTIALLFSTVVFREKMSESRPDIFTLSFVMLSLLHFAKAAQSKEHPIIFRCFLLAGLSLGSAIMFSQKVLLLGPGIVAAVLFYLAYPAKVTRKNRLIALCVFTLGTAAPVIVTALYFLKHDALKPFITNNLLLNAGWAYHFSPMTYFVPILRENVPLALFTVIGLVRGIIHLPQRKSFEKGEFIGVFVLASLFVVMFLMPVPHRQFYLLFIPLAACIASSGIFWTVQYSCASLRKYATSGTKMYAATLPIILVFLVGLILAFGLPLLSEEDMKHVLIVSAILMAIILASIYWRKESIILAVLIGAFAYYPLQLMQLNIVYSHNDETMKAIKLVMDQSKRDDTFFDGWTGYGLFRPNAHYYFFIHDELLAMLTEAQKADIVEKLKEKPPRFVVLDRPSKGISPLLEPWVLEHYVPVEGVKELYKRRDP